MRIKRIWKSKTKRGAIWGLCVGLVNAGVSIVTLASLLPEVEFSLVTGVLVPATLVWNVFTLATIGIALYNIARD